MWGKNYMENIASKNSLWLDNNQKVGNSKVKSMIKKYFHNGKAT